MKRNLIVAAIAGIAVLAGNARAEQRHSEYDSRIDELDRPDWNLEHRDRLSRRL